MSNRRNALLGLGALSGLAAEVGGLFPGTLSGPKPTGLRYCMNGVALNFTPA